MNKIISIQDIAATVVLYNSQTTVISNIETYIGQVQKLYVIDNSLQPNDELIELLKKNNTVFYHSFNGNKGIAKALNWAAKQAIHDGYKLLLTMDDDTRVPEGMVQNMVEFWNKFDKPIGILSGVHHGRCDNTSYRLLPYTLTSGNLLNLQAYQAIGDFRDDLFIDHVDHEFGFRLNERGFLVVELPYINLVHKLGYSQHIKIGHWIIRQYGTNSPIRLYYYARNGFYISRIFFNKYPKFAWIYTKEMSRRFIKTIFFDKNRIYRLRMLIKGLIDGWEGNLGEYKERK